MGLKAIPMRAETGPIGGDLSHEFIILADTGESEVFCHRDYLGLRSPAPTTDFDDAADLAPIVERWTTPYAATDEMHDAAACEAAPGGASGCRRAASRSAIFSTSARSIPKPMGAKVHGPDGKEHFVHMGSYGIGPSRLVGADHRGEP